MFACFNSFHVDNELGCDEFCKGVFSRMNSLEDLKPGAVARCLLPLLSSATLITTPRPNIQVIVSFFSHTSKYRKCNHCKNRARSIPMTYQSHRRLIIYLVL